MSSITAISSSAAPITGKLYKYDGLMALRSRDLTKLKAFYDASGKNWNSFLDVKDIKKFLDSIKEKNEADPEIVCWLLDILPSLTCDDNIIELFTRAAHWGDDAGLPLMQAIATKIPRILSMPYRMVESLNCALSSRTKDLLSVKWLLEKGEFPCFSEMNIKIALKDESWQTIMLLLEHKACREYIPFIFRSAMSLGPEALPKMKLLWEKMPQTLSLFSNSLNQIIGELSRYPSTIPLFLDFVLERLVTLHGSPIGFPECESALFFSPEARTIINEHLKKKGFEFRPNERTINFRQVFKQIGPEGLPFFEEACRSMPQKLSNYTLRWAFLKAAANGEAGIPLMEWLAKNVPERLSYWALEQAGKILETNKDIKTAEWLKALQMSIFKEGAKSPADRDDIDLQFDLSKNPSGCLPLGDALRRLGWKTHTQLDVKNILKFLDSIKEKKEAGPEIISWLLDILPSLTCDDKMNDLFIRAAQWGDAGLPLMQAIATKMPRILSLPYIMVDSLNCALSSRTKDLLSVKWLLEKGEFSFFSATNIKLALKDESWQTVMLLLEHKACIDYIPFLFRSAMSLGAEALPKMKLLWERMPQTQSLCSTSLNQIIGELSSYPSTIPLFLDFVLERLVTLHGSPIGFPDCESALFFSPEARTIINEHLKKKGFEFRPDERTINFRQVFKQIGPEGLPFFEEACRSMPKKLSNYTLRWAFLKAAANGEAGIPLMEWLAKNVPERLSYWALEQARKVLETNKDVKTAEWLKALQMSIFKEGAKSPVDRDDLHLQLVLSKNPSGYRPLGDAPERLGWKPLTQEELNKMKPKDASASPAIEDLFSGLKVVEDNVLNTAPHEIKKTEAALFSQLFAQIMQGNTSIKVQGTEEFKKEIFKLIKMIMNRPSGRWLILFLCRSSKSLPIRASDTAQFDANRDKDKESFIGFNLLKKHSYYVRTGDNQIISQEGTQDAALYHEMIHALHYIQDSDLYFALKELSWDKEYDNLEEQYAIAGCDDDSILLPIFPLTENTYNCESGYRPRYGHQGKLELIRAENARFKLESKADHKEQ